MNDTQKDIQTENATATSAENEAVNADTATEATETTPEVPVTPETPETPEEGKKSREKKKPGIFGRALLVYAGVLLAISVIGLFICWEALAQYEDSQPKHVMEDVTSDFSSYLSDALGEQYKDSLSEYEEWNRVLSEVLLPAFEGEFKYKKAVREYTAENPVYTVYTDSDIANITLSKTGEVSSFGFDSWEVSGVTLVADLSGISTVTAIVEVPTGASVTVNGKPLTGTAESTKSYPFALEWEKAQELPEYSVYTVEGLFSTPVIRASVDGTAMTERMTEGRYSFDYPESMRHSVSITVPYDAAVKLGSVTLGEQLVSDASVPFDGACKYDNAHYKEYTVQGLYAYPAVEVFDSDGKKIETLTHDEKKQNYTCIYAPSDAYKITVVCPSADTALTLNGVDAGADIKAQENGMPVYPFTEGLEKYINGRIPLGYFTLEGVYGKPEIVCKSSDGTALPYTLTEDAEGLTYCFYPSESEALKAEHEKLAVSYTEDYIKYASGGYQIVNRTFAVAASHLLAGSPAYEKLESTKFSFGQNKPYTVKKQEITTYGYTQWGENCFSCLVDFTVDITTSYDVEQKDQRDEVKGMRLTYAKIDGKWQIVGLSM